MKKILLSLAVLLISIGAWAQTEVKTINTSKYYKIHCVSTEHGGNWLCDTEGSINGRATEGTYFVFEQGETEGTYYIKSKVSDKYINVNSGNTDITFDEAKATAWIQTELSKNVAFKSPGTGTGTMYLNNNEASGDCLKVFSGTGNCSQWILEEFDEMYTTKATVTYKFTFNNEVKYTQTSECYVGTKYPDFDVKFHLGVAPTQEKPTGEVEEATVEKVIPLELETLPFVAAANYNSIERWYYLNIRDTDPTYLKYENGVNYIKAADNKAAVDASDDKDAYTWAFIGDNENPFAGYQLVNRKSGETMILSAPTTPNANQNADQLARMVTKEGAAGNTTWTLVPTTHANAAEGAFYVEHPTASAYAFNRQGYTVGESKINVLCYWSSRDTGSAVQVVERPVTDESFLRLAIEEAEDLYEVVSQKVGTAPGTYTEASVNALSDAIDAAKAEGATKAQADALQEAMGNLVVNLIPDPTKFYVLRCAYEDRYLYVDAANNMQYTTKQNSPTSDWTGNYVWQFEGTVNGELKMKSVHTQSYLQTVTNSQAVTFASTNGANVTIAASAYNHGAVTFTAGNENIGIHCNAAPVMGWTNEAGSNHYYIEEVASFSHTLSVGDSQWATLMLAYNTTIPTGVTCYAVTGVDGSAAQLKAVEGTILPANEAVLVNSTAETCKFAYTSTAGSIENNILNGTLVNTNIAPAANTSYYVLSMPKDNPVGFYSAKLNVSTDTTNDGTSEAPNVTYEAFINNANKAYLPVAGAAGARLLFDFGTETAIESIQGAESANAVVYDLAGRRVKGAQKGLYIVNGKVVIK